MIGKREKWWTCFQCFCLWASYGYGMGAFVCRSMFTECGVFKITNITLVGQGEQKRRLRIKLQCTTKSCSRLSETLQGADTRRFVGISVRAKTKRMELKCGLKLKCAAWSKFCFKDLIKQEEVDGKLTLISRLCCAWRRRQWCWTQSLNRIANLCAHHRTLPLPSDRALDLVDGEQTNTHKLNMQTFGLFRVRTTTSTAATCENGDDGKMPAKTVRENRNGLTQLDWMIIKFVLSFLLAFKPSQGEAGVFLSWRAKCVCLFFLCCSRG